MLALPVLAAACMDASRVNTTCRWSDSEPRTLDLSRASDRDHLRVDVKLAGDLPVFSAGWMSDHVSDATPQEPQELLDIGVGRLDS